MNAVKGTSRAGEAGMADDRAGQLLKKLGESFAEYKECQEHDPRLQEKALAFDEINQKIFNRIKTTMERRTTLRDAGTRKPAAGRAGATGARQEILPYARDAGRGAFRRRSACRNLADANANPGAIARERRPWWTESWITSRRRYWGITATGVEQLSG